MSRMKTFFPVFIGTALIMSGANVYASSNAQLTVTANIVQKTCDVSISTPNIDLGNYSPAQFKEAGVAKPISESVRNFILGLSNCDIPLAKGDVASLTVTGQTIPGFDTIFNSNNMNAGVMLNEAGKDTFIANGQKIEVATAGETPSESDFNNKTLNMQVGLASTSLDNIAAGNIQAPILFSFTYN